MMHEKNMSLVENAINLRNSLNQTNCKITDIMRIYINTPVSDHIKYDAELGGYIPHKKKLPKKNYYV